MKMQKKVKRTSRGAYFASYMTAMLISMVVLAPQARAGDGGAVVQPPPLAFQLVTQAKALEKVQVSAAITMMLEREGEVIEESTPAQLAHYYNKLAELNSTLGHFVEVKAYADKGLAIYSSDSAGVVADLYYHLGYFYEGQVDYVTARKHYTTGYSIAVKSGDGVVQGRGKLYLASLYTYEEDYASALKYMKESYAIAMEVGNGDLSWEVMNELGLLYSYLEEPEEAAKIHLQAVEIAKKIQVKELSINSLFNLAHAYVDMKDYDKANFYFNQMLSDSKASTEKSNMYSAYKGFAVVGLKSGQYERALAYLQKAEEYLPYIEGVMSQFHHYYMKADILTQMEQTNKALEAYVIAEQKLPNEQKSNDKLFGLGMLRIKAQLNANQGMYKQGYELLDSYNEGYTKFRTLEKDKTEGKLRIAFDVERNQSRNRMLEKENQIKVLQLKQAKSEQQIQTFFLVALALLSLGLIFVMYRQLHSRRQLKTIAETDSLTNLSNRRYALAKGAELVDESSNDQIKVSVMLFDLDHFKSVNDTYGHGAGDEVLKSIAATTKSCLRDSDVMARIGGEEFLAILPGVSIDTAQLIAERLKDKLAAQEQQSEEERFHVTASFGVAMADGAESFEALIRRADKAMYQAKANGRNCVEVA